MNSIGQMKKKYIYDKNKNFLLQPSYGGFKMSSLLFVFDVILYVLL